MLDMARTREVFEASTDFTLAVEEEFQLLDPETLALAPRYTDLRALTDGDPVLADAVAGEVIEAGVENCSRRCGRWAGGGGSPRDARARPFPVAGGNGKRVGAAATPPRRPRAG